MRRVEVATGAVTTIAGSGEDGDADGVGDTAEFNNPSGLAISPDGDALFVADNGNRKIRRVEVATGEVTTVAGSGTEGSADGMGDAAEFDGPDEVALSPDGSTLLVNCNGGLRQVCVAAPPPPPSFAPIVVPPSTLAADFAKTRGDASLPEGKVAFLVGDDEERIDDVSKCVICARSPVFRTMFGIGMKERDAAEVTVSHTDLASFTALVDYLLSDKFDLGEEGGRAQRALDLRELAQMYQVPRLELLCAQALQEVVAPATAVPLLEAAHTTGDGRLLAQCRRYVADHAAEVRASGGVEQLRDFGVAELKGTVAARDAELEKVRAEVAERA
uniref:BTB domain-containing protein n=1 Tax=Emiliania huxleyi (strain CCMP1516) TaxID=280463 RepID=A0A0D3ILW1_EMIH1